MAVLLAETFDDTAVGSVPSGWSSQKDPIPTADTAYWTTAAAPAGCSGNVAQGLQNKTTSHYLTHTWTAAGAGTTFRLRAKTGGDNTTRWFSTLFYSGTTLGAELLAYSSGHLLLTGISPGVKGDYGLYSASTVYDLSFTLGSAGALTAGSLNGVAQDVSGESLGNSLTTLDTVRIDVYAPTLVSAGNNAIDLLIVDTSVAAPNGTLLNSGSLDGNALGVQGATYVLGYSNGSSVAAAFLKLERSNDGGTTWSDVSTSITKTATASGFVLTDNSPGATPSYRATASNGSGDQVVTPSVVTGGAVAYSVGRTIGVRQPDVFGVAARGRA